MNVIVYRSLKKNNCYLYLPDTGLASELPQALQHMLGKLERALEFDLHPERKTALNNAGQILEDLDRQGYHLQLVDPAAIGLQTASLKPGQS